MCINKGENLPINIFQVTALLHDWGRLVSLTRSTSPRETPNTHYMILHWGLLPRITTEVVPQGLDTIKTFHKEVNTSPIGVQQHTMIIYFRISFEVTNTSTLPLN